MFKRLLILTNLSWNQILTLAVRRRVFVQCTSLSSGDLALLLQGRSSRFIHLGQHSTAPFTLLCLYIYCWCLDNFDFCIVSTIGSWDTRGTTYYPDLVPVDILPGRQRAPRIPARIPICFLNIVHCRSSFS